MKDTDLLQAQSNLYRRLSTNLYGTRDHGKYCHLHGSLEATTSINTIGLKGYRPVVKDYHEALDLIESYMDKYSVTELEKLNAKYVQAGVECLKYEISNRLHM